MKRKELIEAKLEEGKKVDLEEIEADDVQSLKLMQSTEEGKAHAVRKEIKAFQSNPDLVLGDEFLALVEKERDIEDRIKLIELVRENHV